MASLWQHLVCSECVVPSDQSDSGSVDTKACLLYCKLMANTQKKEILLSAQKQWIFNSRQPFATADKRERGCCCLQLVPGWLLQVGREQREDTHRHIGRPTCHRLLSNVSSGQNSHYRTENTETTFIFDLLFALFYFTLPLRQCLLIFSAFLIWHCRLTEVVQSQIQSRPVYRRWCSLCVFSLFSFTATMFRRTI